MVKPVRDPWLDYLHAASPGCFAPLEVPPAMRICVSPQLSTERGGGQTRLNPPRKGRGSKRPDTAARCPQIITNLSPSPVKISGMEGRLILLSAKTLIDLVDTDCCRRRFSSPQGMLHRCLENMKQGALSTVLWLISPTSVSEERCSPAVHR
jgi:hypothetical protein